MGLSFAGIPLCSPTAQVESWIARNFALDDIYQFARTHWHERTNGYYPVHPPEEHRPILLNSLRWPVGASRWAVGHFLVTDNQLARIRPLAYSRPPTAAGGVISTVRYRSLPLVMYDGRNPQTNKIETNLYMLPPRPLAKRANRNGMYLLTLVDERFFWWSRSAQINVTDTFTTWTQLYTDVATGLGVTVTPDTIDTAYLRPSPALAQQYRFLPPLLDAVAYNVGHRVVRKLDGTVITQAARTARKQQSETTYTVMAGGEFALTKFPPTDANDAIPQTVAVAFPEFLEGNLASTPRVFAVDLTDIATALPELSGASITGYTGTKFFRDTAIVCGCEEQGSYSGSLSGTNIPDVAEPDCNETEMQLLANQVAEDFYLWQLSGAKDIKYAGVVNRPLEALHDTEWRFRRDECSTRVQRAQPWMDTITDLSHTSEGVCGGLGPVTQTVTLVAETLCISGWLNVFHRAFTYIGGLLSRVGGAFLSHYAGCCDCGNASSEPVAPPDPPPDPPPYTVDCRGVAIKTTLYARVTAVGTAKYACQTSNLLNSVYPLTFVSGGIVGGFTLGIGQGGAGEGWIGLKPTPLQKAFSGYFNSNHFRMYCIDGRIRLSLAAMAMLDEQSVVASSVTNSPFRATFILPLLGNYAIPSGSAHPLPWSITVVVTEEDPGWNNPTGNTCQDNLSPSGHCSDYPDTLCLTTTGITGADAGPLNVTNEILYRVTSAEIGGGGDGNSYSSKLIEVQPYGWGRWYFTTYGLVTRLYFTKGGNNTPAQLASAAAACASGLPRNFTFGTSPAGIAANGGTGVVSVGSCAGGESPCAAGPAATALKSAITYTLTGVTVAAGDLLIITVAYLAVQPPGPNPTGNTCTYNGSAMTLAKREYTHTADTKFVVVEIWYRSVPTAQTGTAVVIIPNDMDELAIMAATKVDCLTNNAPVATDSFYAVLNSVHNAGTLTVVANNYVHAAIVTLNALTADADGTWNVLTDAGQDRTQNNQLRLCEGMYVATGSEVGGQVQCTKGSAATRTYAGVCVAFN